MKGLAPFGRGSGTAGLMAHIRQQERGLPYQSVCIPIWEPFRKVLTKTPDLRYPGQDSSNVPHKYGHSWETTSELYHFSVINVTAPVNALHLSYAAATQCEDITRHPNRPLKSQI